jgi:hypothetical protein
MFAQTVGFNPAILHVVNPLPSVIWPLYLNYIVAVVFCQIIAAAICKSTKYGTIKLLLQKFNGSLSNKFDTCSACGTRCAQTVLGYCRKCLSIFITAYFCNVAAFTAPYFIFANKRTD